MGDEHSGDQSQIRELVDVVRDLQRRVNAIEERLSVSHSSDVVDAAQLLRLEPGTGSMLPPGSVAVLGRALLGIAGAYLLRALAESGSVATYIAVPVALVYAVTWLIGATRVASPSSLATATYGLTAALILSPMLWETTVRFRAIPSVAAASALAIFLVLALWLAWARNATAVIWISTITVLLTCWALIIATHDVAPFAVAAVLVAAAVEYAAANDHWLALRWIAALTADLAVILIAYLVTRSGGLPEGYTPLPPMLVVGLPLVLALIYTVSTLVRTLARTLTVTGFEIVQMAAVLVLSFVVLLQVTEVRYHEFVELSSLLLGVGAYAIAFRLVIRRAGSGRTFETYATFGLFLIAAGSYLLAPSVALALAALLLGGAGAVMLSRVLCVHCAICLTVSTIVSGALVYTVEKLTPPADVIAAPAVILNGAVAAVLYAIFYRRSVRTVAMPVATTTAAVAAYIAAVGAATTAVLLLRAGAPPAVVASLCTALISGSALALVWIAGRWGCVEARWIAWAAMVSWGVKLVIVDLSQGRPLSLFASLVVYGGTLILLSRWKSTVRQQTSEAKVLSAGA